MTDHLPPNRNPRSNGRHSWSEAFVPAKDRPSNEPMGFRVERETER